ncbi:MAG: sulfurtransferase TusA family protein [Hydrogenovibrio sp.]|jgi:tRNA 2-thiouridine synthesizing protein A
MNSEPDVLDVSGLPCPMPLVKLKKYLSQNPNAERVTLIATDKGALKDIPAFCQVYGLPCELVSSEEKITFLIGLKN